VYSVIRLLEDLNVAMMWFFCRTVANLVKQPGQTLLLLHKQVIAMEIANMLMF